MSCRLESSDLWFNAKRHDAVGILIGDEQESAGGIDPETARSLSPGGFMTYVCKSSGALIDPEDHKAVVTPVRAVDKCSRRRDLDIAACALTAEPLRECGNNLQLFERP